MIIRTLLEQGADPNVENGQLSSPLSIAVEKNNVEIVKLLLQYG